MSKLRTPVGRLVESTLNEIECIPLVIEVFAKHHGILFLGTTNGKEMKTAKWKIVIILLTASSLILSQSNYFRSGVFLHHSTGGCIWSSGSTTNVPNEISKYNSNHSLSGQLAVSLKERSWPETPWNNEWERWHRIFENKDLVDADIRPILQSNKIVVIKSCFPSSNIWSNGVPSDTLNPKNKSAYNYKWHWRHIVRAMKNYSGNFFVIWTNAPLAASSTNSAEAKRSHDFCLWAKDTLAAGLDKEIKQFPNNVYIFDFYHKLVGTDWKLQPQFAENVGDSHPNAKASKLVAPQFVTEIFDRALEYEKKYSAVEGEHNLPVNYVLEQNYPNPFNPSTVIKYSLPERTFVNLMVYNLLGREEAVLVNKEMPAGYHSISFDAGQLPSGIYFYRLQTRNNNLARKMLLIR